MTIEYIKP